MWMAGGFYSSLQTSAKMHAPAGSDYFVFHRDQFSDIPDFAVVAQAGITG
jgi:hypothetical protein